MEILKEFLLFSTTANGMKSWMKIDVLFLDMH